MKAYKIHGIKHPLKSKKIKRKQKPRNVRKETQHPLNLITKHFH